MKPETFIEYFRARHDWWCHPGSAIHKDLTAFALENANSPDSADELYLIFCTLHGIKPKPKRPVASDSPALSQEPEQPEKQNDGDRNADQPK